MTEISSFWYTPKGYKGIGLMEILTIKSWLDNGYKFHLYTYNLDDKIFLKFQELFSNFILKDANEIVPFSEYFSDDRGAGVATFSDYFRYILLYLRGGVWVDLDMVCLNHMDLSQEYIFNQETDENGIERITNSFLKFPKNSDFGKNLIQEAKKIIDNKKIIPWGVIGPNFLDKLVKENKLEKYALDYKDTCQVPYYKVFDFINKDKNIDENRLCLHLFSEMWRKNNINKNYFYKDGIYTKLLRKYNVKNLSIELGFKNSFFDIFLMGIIFIKYVLRLLKRKIRKKIKDFLEYL